MGLCLRTHVLWQGMRGLPITPGYHGWGLHAACEVSIGAWVPQAAY